MALNKTWECVYSYDLIMIYFGQMLIVALVQGPADRYRSHSIEKDVYTS